ncbi:MAG: alpha/beta fold hydrolase, partial [Stackebrandtia sp.]
MSYADVNGLSMYYEAHGEGEATPLVLVHGGFGLGAEFAPILPSLTKGRTVITVDLQGHGHTADIDRPLRPDLMADDVAALIRHLGLEQADVMGYSLGGYVALQTAIRHPRLVRRLVTVSIPLRRDGWYPSVLSQHEHFGADAVEAMKQSPVYATYEAVAPRAEDWAVLVTKTGESMRRDFDYTQQAEAIECPVLLVFADADAIRFEHIVEVFRSFGGGQGDPGWDGSGGRGTAELAILPGSTHYDVGVSPKLPTAVVPFLDK